MQSTYTYLILILVALSAYIAGILTPIPVQFKATPEKQVKESVLDSLTYPESARFKNISYYSYRKDMQGREIGFFCGEVSDFNHEKPNTYKCFIVRTLKHDNGNMDISIPMIPKTDDMQAQKEFNTLWNKRCHKYKKNNNTFIE
ncbi:MAG: hypothetical protein LBE52_04765 [Providencia sp.]|jgi:hypothetical protein|nr:hypothetical protein [Providencia sp.]